MAAHGGDRGREVIALPSLFAPAAAEIAPGHAQKPHRRRSSDSEECLPRQTPAVALPRIGDGRSAAGKAASGDAGPSSAPPVRPARRRHEEPRHSTEYTIKTVREALARQAGGLKKAYRAMDLSKTGVVDLELFEAGLKGLGIGPHDIDDDFADARGLFDTIDTRGLGLLSLQELLGVVPKQHRSKSFADTRACFAAYVRNAAAQKGSLERAPRWQRSPTPPPEVTPGGVVDGGDAGMPSEDPDAAHRQRLELRRRLKAADGRSGKRALAGGLLGVAAYEHAREKERRDAIRRQERIMGSIDACSQARRDLIGLQRAMKLVAEEPRRRSSGGDDACQSGFSAAAYDAEGEVNVDAVMRQHRRRSVDCAPR